MNNFFTVLKKALHVEKDSQNLRKNKYLQIKSDLF